MTQKEFIEQRRRQLDTLIHEIGLLIEGAHNGDAFAREDEAMAVFDALCEFSRDDYLRARDVIFDAGYDETIPSYIVNALAKCRNALVLVRAGYSCQDRENYVMYDALYDLFEIDALSIAAEEFEREPV